MNLNSGTVQNYSSHKFTLKNEKETAKSRENLIDFWLLPDSFFLHSEKCSGFKIISSLLTAFVFLIFRNANAVKKSTQAD
jgi:hypothetical protein